MTIPLKRAFFLPVFLLIRVLTPALPAQIVVTYTNGDALNVSRATTVAVPLTLTIASGSASEAGVISGDGTITKTGAGSLTFSADNTYTGATTISAGTLQLGNGGTSGSVAGNIVLSYANSSTLAVNRSDTLTLAGNITGKGTVSITNGTLQLTTSNQLGSTSGAYNGIIVNFSNTAGAVLDVSGTQKVSGLNGGGTTGGNVVLQPGSTLQLLGYANFQSDFFVSSFAGNITGTGNFLFNGTNLSGGVSTSVTQFLTGTNTFAGSVTVSGVNNFLSIGAGGTVGSLVADIALGSGGTATFNRSDASTYAGAVSGTGGTFTKSGAGTLSVTGASTFTGTTTVSAGTLQIGAGGTSGSWAGSIANNTTLSFNRSDLLTHTATISGTGGVTQTGTGTLTLSGSNTYTGGTTLSAGTLALGSSTALGSSGTISFAGGTLQYTASNTTDYSSRFSTAAGQNYKLDTNGQSVMVASALTSSGGSLTKSGVGTLTLSGANTYSGDTTVTGGTLTLGNSLALQNSGLVLSGGSLSFGTLTAATLGGISGNLALTNANSAGVTLSLGNGVTNYASAANLSGNGGLLKSGTNTLTLSGTNSYTGATTLNAGILAVGSNGALGTGALALNGGALQAGGGAYALPNAVALNSATTINGSQPLTLAGAMTLNGFNALNVTNSAQTTLSGAIGESGPSIFIKQGSGELQLTGANTYTGGTFIQAGTLRINNLSGSAFGTGAVTVASGATLAGAGSFTGALQLNGTFSPGNSPGIAATGSQTWSGGGAYVWEINNGTGTSGTNYDLLAITGALTITATSASRFTLSLTSLLPDNSPGNVINFNSAINHTYTVATASSGITGFSPSAFTLDTTGFTNAANGGSWSLGTNGNDLNLTFTASAIPEPGTYAALLGATALALALYRRRRPAPAR